MRKASKLNIGCGPDVKKDYVNLDILHMKGVDVVHDLNKYPYPFKDEEFEEILCSSVLEHLDDIGKAMKEIHRILKKNGKVKIIVPHFTSSNAYTDPTHKHWLGYFSFDFYCGDSFYYDFKFKVVKRKLIFGKKYAIWNWIVEPLANAFPKIYENTPVRIFPAMDIEIVLEK